MGSLLAFDAPLNNLILVESKLKCSELLIDVSMLKAAYGSTARVRAVRVQWHVGHIALYH
jgi:hypothetical protein